MLYVYLTDMDEDHTAVLTVGVNIRELENRS